MTWLLYVLGVALASMTGFLSPWWFLGFAPLSAGLLWASYVIEEVAGGESVEAPKRPLD